MNDGFEKNADIQNQEMPENVDLEQSNELSDKIETPEETAPVSAEIESSDESAELNDSDEIFDEKIEVSNDDETFDEKTESTDESIITASETVETVDDVLDELKSLQKRHDIVDDIFDGPDGGEPIRQWTMADINKLIYGAEQKADIEQQSPDFDIDKYHEYIMPENMGMNENDAVELTDYNDTSVKDEYEKNLDSKNVYVSKDYEEEITESETENLSGLENEIEDEFEDVYSSYDEVSENDESSNQAQLTDDFDIDESEMQFQKEDENKSSEEFEPLADEEIVQVENAPQEEFETKDYLKIKDIFRNSKFFKNRREKGVQVKKAAAESVKNTFGSDVIKDEDKESASKKKKTVPKKGEKELSQNRAKKSEDDLKKEFAESETEKIFGNEKNEIDGAELFDGVDDTYFEREESHEEVYVQTRDEGPDLIVENEDEISEEFYEVIEESDANSRHQNMSEEDNVFANADEDNNISFETFINNFAGKNLAEEITKMGSEDEMSEDDDLLFSSQEKKRRFKLTNIPEDYNDFDTSYFSPEKGRYDEEEYLELKDENNPKSIASAFKKTLSPNHTPKLKEYRSMKEKPQMVRELSERRKHSVLTFLALCFLSLLLWVIMDLPIIQQFASSVTAEAGLLNGVSLLVLLMAYVVSSRIMQTGIRGLIKRKINKDTPIAVALIVAVLNSVLLFFNLLEANNTLPIYSSAIMFGLLLTSYGHILQDSRALKCFKAITTNDKMGIHSVQNIEDRIVSENVARIASKRGKNIKYSAKAVFPARFLYNSFENDFSDRMSRRVFPLVLIISILISIISGIINKSVLNIFAVLSASLCIGVPFSQIVSIDLPLFFANRKLAKSSSAIVGHSAITQAGKTNAIVVKSTDIYNPQKCIFHGLQEFGNAKVDDIIRYAATILIHSKGPLSHAFDNVFIGEQAKMLPRVEDLEYDERLGLSGKIYGQRILVGNRKLLLKYNLEAPEKGTETKFRNEGKKLLYVAIDNIVAAMLIVEYGINEDVSAMLSKLEKNRVSVVVTTNDCNIDEETISLDFNIDRENIRVIGDYEGSLLRDYENVQKEAVPARMIHNGTSRGYLGCMASAIALNNSSKLISIVQLLFVVIGLLMTMIFAFSGNLSTLNGTFIIIYQAICSLIAIVASIIRYKN